MDLNKGIVVKNLSGHNQEICTIKKIIHPKYGKCLLLKFYIKISIFLFFKK